MNQKKTPENVNKSSIKICVASINKISAIIAWPEFFLVSYVSGSITYSLMMR